MQFRVSPQALGECSAAEWQARVDLAAAHRLAVMHGFNEGIFNMGGTAVANYVSILERLR
jgi:hypothetical protein